MDDAVEALRRLVGSTPRRRAEIAAALGVNEQNLYQILAGKKLKSGRPRGIGRDLRDKLDEHFPGWLTWTAHRSEMLTLRSPPTVSDALQAIQEALRLADSTAREALAINMAGWARSGGDPQWTEIVASIFSASRRKQVGGA